MDNDTRSSREGRKSLDPSELGTKEYWEATYAREIQNNTNDTSDEGVIWFDESNAEDTVIRHLSSYTSQGRNILDRERCRFLDLGTGNGHMLFALREDEVEEGGTRWTGQMIGVDYSPTSVKLARCLNDRRREVFDDEAASYASIQFAQWDLLSEPAGEWLGPGFDVVLDKGTFDAISLMPHSEQAPQPCDTYRDTVAGLIKPGCFLFITSCNWTKDELVEWLAPPGGPLSLFDEARYPTFTFGGRTGQSVVTAIFQRKQPA